MLGWFLAMFLAFAESTRASLYETQEHVKDYLDVFLKYERLADCHMTIVRVAARSFSKEYKLIK